MHEWMSMRAAALAVALAVAVWAGPKARMIALPAAEVGERGTGALATTMPMRVNRAAHTATALADGRVLVAGGFVEKGAAEGAELYDPVTRRFATAAPMVETRHSHTATVLADGRVLIAGGYGAGTVTLASTELFDPRTNTFASAGPLLSARADHIAVRLGNGMVLIAGGLGPGWTYLASAEIYDPIAGRFQPIDDMTVARESHVAVLLADGRVLVVGGHRGRRAEMVLHASAETYDPATRRFTRVGDMRVPRHKHDAVRLGDGRVLVTGGADRRDGDGVYDSTELFEPTAGTFSAGSAMRLPRYKHAGSSLLLPTGQVLIAGGADRAETYDPVRRTFTLVDGDPRMPGLFSAVAPLPSGGALVTGGYGRGRGPESSAWVFFP